MKTPDKLTHESPPSIRPKHTIEDFLAGQKKGRWVCVAIVGISLALGLALIVTHRDLGGNWGLALIADGLLLLSAAMGVGAYWRRCQAAAALARGEGVLLRWRDRSDETILGEAGLFFEHDLVRFGHEMRIKDVLLSNDRKQLRINMRQMRFSFYRHRREVTLFIPPELVPQVEAAAARLRELITYRLR